MNKFTFKCKSGEVSRSIEIEFEAFTVSEVLDEVGNFLRGCGYVIQGEIEEVKYPEED